MNNGHGLSAVNVAAQSHAWIVVRLMHGLSSDSARGRPCRHHNSAPSHTPLATPRNSLFASASLSPHHAAGYAPPVHSLLLNALQATLRYLCHSMLLSSPNIAARQATHRNIVDHFTPRIHAPNAGLSAHRSDLRHASSNLYAGCARLRPTSHQLPRRHGVAARASHFYAAQRIATQATQRPQRGTVPDSRATLSCSRLIAQRHAGFTPLRPTHRSRLTASTHRGPRYADFAPPNG